MVQLNKIKFEKKTVKLLIFMLKSIRLRRRRRLSTEPIFELSLHWKS